MSHRTKIVFILLTVGVMGFVACNKFEKFPIEPVIKYDKFVLLSNPTNGITERGVLQFSYTDGDGDLGLSDKDTEPPFNFGGEYYYNLIINYFEKQNGKFVEVPLLTWNPDSLRYDTLSFNGRFPVLTPETGNLSIKGIFQDTLFIYNPLSEFDTIKFSAYIIDRALHKSNMIETGEIIRVK
ncbi:MAG: hypothetical protein L3J31_05105 [Bacteroidales bacterium]|nr:hypothetical protein [Bacteroidales bacterium]MCF6342165.1 hypothetical protein [Bacteroidales bacterium]